MRGILQAGDTTLGAIDYLPAYALSALRAESPPVIGFEPASAASRGLRVSIPEIEYGASFGKALRKASVMSLLQPSIRKSTIATVKIFQRCSSSTADNPSTSGSVIRKFSRISHSA